MAQPPAGMVDDREVFLDAVVGLHLEAPPVCPQSAAHALRGEPVGQLVGLGSVMESRNPVAEFLRDIEHGRHFVRAIAVVVDEDVAAHHFRERLELQVTFRRLGRERVLVFRSFLLLVLRELGVVFLPVLHVVLRIRKGLAVTGDIAHARLGELVVIAVHAFRVLAAGHLESLRRAREFHRLVSRRGNVLERHAAPTDQVRGTRKDLQGCHPAVDCRLEARVLGPHAVLDPDVCGDRLR